MNIKLMSRFIVDVLVHFKKKSLATISLTVLMAFTSGIGVVMLVPLLSITGLTNGRAAESNFPLPAIWGKLSTSSQVLTILGVYILLIGFSALVNRQVTLLNAQLVQGYTNHLRVTLYEHTVYAEWEQLTQMKKADLVNAFTTETARISSGILHFLKIISQVIVAVVQLTIAFWMSAPLTILVCVSGAVMFFTLQPILKESRKLGQSMQLLNRQLQSDIQDQLEGMKELKSYGIEATQLTHFQETTDRMEQNILRFSRVQSKPDVFYKLGAAVMISFFFYLAVFWLKEDTATLAVMVFIFSRLWPVFSSFQNSLVQIHSVLPTFEHITSLREKLQDSKECQTEDAEEELPFTHNIEFRNVEFTYQQAGSQSLKGVSFTIPIGQMTAIVGTSGAGKTTMVDVLLGLIKPTNGHILVDGVPLAESSLRKWREKIAYVPQEPFLLHDTIRENFLRFTPSATEEEIWEALSLAQASDLVRRLPEGLDTVIGDRGVKLSGGERQRLILARALVKKPELLILDEATSALDPENERQIQTSIDALKGTLTIVVIAHRLTTIQGADQVLVLEQGKIEEIGSYKELAEKKDGILYGMLHPDNKGG